MFEKKIYEMPDAEFKVSTFFLVNFWNLLSAMVMLFCHFGYYLNKHQYTEKERREKKINRAKEYRAQAFKI